jgi:hypothetical protein
MTTKKSIKEEILKQFNMIPRDANWYAGRYYSFLKVKKQIKANTFIENDTIIMQWEKGVYKIKIHDYIDRSIMITLLITN